MHGKKMKEDQNPHLIMVRLYFQYKYIVYTEYTKYYPYFAHYYPY